MAVLAEHLMNLESKLKTREGKIAKEYLMIADLMEYHFQKRGRSGR